MTKYRRRYLLDKFFSLLPKTGWFLQAGVYLRKRKSGSPANRDPESGIRFMHCPISAAAQHAQPGESYADHSVNTDFAKEILGLPKALAIDIMEAADNVVPHWLCQRALRRRLLRHCGPERIHH